jgi:tetratricopeptide (TPR) repeat protein
LSSLDHLRTAYQDRRLSDAWVEYKRLAAQGEASAEAHLYGALAAWADKRLYEARWAIEKAVESDPRGTVLGQVRMVHGVILREIGEIRAAIIQLELFINNVNEYPQLGPVALGAAHYNLGLAYRQAKRLPDSLEAYTIACSEFRREGLKTNLCQALHNFAWAACLLGETEAAREALEESSTLIDSNPLRYHQQIGEALLKATSGNLTTAMELCQAITDQDDSMPHGVRSHAYWVSGKVALQLGLVQEALSLAKQSVHYAAVGLGEDRCLTDASELLHEIRALHLEPTGS